MIDTGAPTQTDGQKPTGAPAEPKMIPESDLLAVKGSLEGRLGKASKELETTKVELADVRAKLQETEEAKALGLAKDEDLDDTRREIVTQRVALSKRDRDLAAKEAALRGRESVLERTRIAAEYGIKPSDLEDVEDVKDMEIKALKLTKEAGDKGKDTKPAPKTGASDAGAGGGAASPTLTAKEKIMIGLKGRQQK